MEQIVIVGDKVKVIEETVKKEVPIEQFMGYIENNLPVDTGILPKNCIYMRRNNGNMCYVIEVPATLCKVTYATETTKNNYVISIPFTQFYINAKENGVFGDFYVTVTKSPVRKLDDKLFIAPYLNIHSMGRGKVCTGTMRAREDGTLSEKINGLVSSFFESESNNDLTPCIPRGFKTSTDNYGRFYKEWHDFTKTDRFFGVSNKVEYYERGLKLSEMVEVALGMRVE